MKRRSTRKREDGASRPGPYRLKLPGFITDDAVGLGDVIKRATTAIGVRPCGGCERRAAALNRWIAISGWGTR